MTFFVPLLTSCSNNGSITVANFESYMSPQLMNKIRSQIGSSLSYVYYGTNEDIEMKFDRYYDVAIPSTYEVINLLNGDELLKIDWPKFAIPGVNNADDAYALLFSDTTKAYLDNVNSYVENTFPQWSNFNILNYAIPYFLQDWSFAYKGDEISGLENVHNWNDLIHQINATNLDDRFKPQKNPKMSMVDDSRSVYSMCRLLETGNNVNPPDGNVSIDQFKNTYRKMTDQYNNGKSYFYLNTDSANVLYTIADPNGSNGGIAYNGDLLYAALGGGNSEWDDQWNDDNFHIVKPDASPVALDMMVINKRVAKKSNDKVNDIYQIVKNICLDGATSNDISLTDDNGNYVYGPMMNFDFVLYTSTLKKIDDYVIDPQGYFSEYSDSDLLKKIYTIDPDRFTNNTLIEQPISNIDKSNMYEAYLRQKESL